MIKNLFSQLPGLKSDDAEHIAEVDEAQAKADRIAFHRTHVRNGPANFKTQTNGQAKRARVRALARETKKARRAQVRNYLQTQRLAATVRGQLQLAGVLPYADGRTPDPVRQVKAVVWIVQRFGPDEVSFKSAAVIDALNSALKFYSQATGHLGLSIPVGYVLPIHEVEQPA